MVSVRSGASFRLSACAGFARGSVSRQVSRHLTLMKRMKRIVKRYVTLMKRMKRIRTEQNREEKKIHTHPSMI